MSELSVPPRTPVNQKYNGVSRAVVDSVQSSVKKTVKKVTEYRNRLMLDRKRRDAVKQRQVNACSDIRRIELEIAQLRFDLADKRENLLTINAELDACQQMVDASRTQYAKLKKRLHATGQTLSSGDDDNENDSEMWSAESDSDISVHAAL